MLPSWNVTENIRFHFLAHKIPKFENLNFFQACQEYTHTPPEDLDNNQCKNHNKKGEHISWIKTGKQSW